MLTVRATRKPLALVDPPGIPDGLRCTTHLGQWYATVLPWRSRVALLVNESTLLPALMPLAPAATWPNRVGEEIAGVLAAHGAPTGFITEELRQMRECALGATANRSVVGVMNEFVFLAGVHRRDHPRVDLLDLAMWLAATPCGPLYQRNVSPDRELAAMLRSLDS